MDPLLTNIALSRRALGIHEEMLVRSSLPQPWKLPPRAELESVAVVWKLTELISPFLLAIEGRGSDAVLHACHRGQ